jgi:hypothetical protein
VSAPVPALAAGAHRAPVRRRGPSGRSRPTRLLSRRGSASRISRRTD